MSKRPIAATGKPTFTVKPIPKALSVPDPSTKTPKAKPKTTKPKAAKKEIAVVKDHKETATDKPETKPTPKKANPKRDTTITLNIELGLYQKVIKGVENYDLSPQSFAAKKLLKLYRAFESEPLVLDGTADISGEIEKVQIRIRYSPTILQAIQKKIDPLELRSAADLLGTAFIQYLRRTL